MVGMSTQPIQPTFYEAVGGHETFVALVRRFYEGVAADPQLRALYPDEDLGPAEERLRMFLEQYWGGPSTYSEQRGHPRLRMRHMPFRVNPEARDRWLAHMRVAVDELGLSPLHEATLWDYLHRAALAMVNTFEPTGIGAGAHLLLEDVDLVDDLEELRDDGERPAVLQRLVGRLEHLGRESGRRAASRRALSSGTVGSSSPATISAGCATRCSHGRLDHPHAA